MDQTQVKKLKPSINDIARSAGAGKIDPIFYNPKCPHNQPFNLNKKDQKGN